MIPTAIFVGVIFVAVGGLTLALQLLCLALRLSVYVALAIFGAACTVISLIFFRGQLREKLAKPAGQPIIVRDRWA